MIPPTTIIGVDCATQPDKTGLARAVWDGGPIVLQETACGSRHDLPAAIVSRWLIGVERALLALDAPLGWPLALGRELAHHAAGQPLDADPAELFRRNTDRFIEQSLGKRPLEVGADRIARTAHAALQLLAAVSAEIGRPIPLVSGPGELEPVGAIEVYPAATRLARGVPNRPGALVGLGGEFAADLGCLDDASPDIRDAVVCTLAGADFLAGWALAPDDLALAQREGWIWVRQPVGARLVASRLHEGGMLSSCQVPDPEAYSPVVRSSEPLSIGARSPCRTNPLSACSATSRLGA